jgi:hypothetical protein
MAVHQCACFSINPMSSHEQAVMRTGRYLLSTKGQGMIYRPDPSKGIKVYIDAGSILNIRLKARSIILNKVDVQK